MAKATFVDTSGFYALLVPNDDMHAAAQDVLRSAVKKRARFVTTDYVLDETATLLKTRGHGHVLPAFFESVFASRACGVEWMDARRFARAKVLFLQRKDHAWSFTDCFSFILMRELGVRRALTKDKHFLEAGFMPLLV